MKGGVPVLGTPCSLDQNDMGSRYMKESGLYRLVAKSKMPFAEAFQDWVEEEVLPSTRKTGSYSVQAVDSRRGQEAQSRRKCS